MITIKDFSDFLGLGREKTPGMKASGILVVTKTVSLDRVLNIPKSTRFDSESGYKYFTTEDNTISESATFLPVAVVSQSPGQAYNIPANQVWTSPQIGGVSVANPQAFTGGQDSLPEIKGIYPQRQKGIGPSDNQLQRCIDVAVAVIRGMIGLSPKDDFPYTDSRVREAVFLLALYRLENNQIQETRFQKPSLHATSPEESRYFRANVYKPLMGQVSGLISHLTRWDMVINGGMNESA